MLTFKYTARDSASGQKINSEIQAESEKSAAKLIQAQGFAPLNIQLKEGQEGGLRGLLHRIPTKEKVIFSRQLSTLINAGLPLIQSLRLVAGQLTNKPLKIIVNSVINEVEAGSTLAEAMAKHPKAFNGLYISLIASGEASGTLDVALERLAHQQEKDAEIVSKIRGAMVYPIIVLSVMVAVVIFMLSTVLPQVQELYKGLPDAHLPFVTNVLLAVGNIINHFWWLAVIVVGTATFTLFNWVRTPKGRRAIDTLKMRVWPLGPLFMKLYMARFARTGTTLVGSGVPLLQMLSVTASAIGNVRVAESITSASEKVKGGKSLSEGLAGDPNFLELVPNMIHIGEQSGSLESMLSKTADYYEHEVDNQIKTISTIVEPVLMIAMGIMALFIAAAVLLPIYSLAGKTIIR